MYYINISLFLFTLTLTLKLTLRFKVALTQKISITQTLRSRIAKTQVTLTSLAHLRKICYLNFKNIF